MISGNSATYNHVYNRVKYVDVKSLLICEVVRTAGSSL